MIESSTKELYAMFLDSRWWRDLSSAKRLKVGKCERCGEREMLQSHHRFYRDNWFETRPEDLEVLCRGCHEKEHNLVQQPTVPEFVTDVHREIWEQYLRSSPSVKAAIPNGKAYAHIRNKKDLMTARSRHEISRAEFDRLLPLMPNPPNRNTKANRKWSRRRKANRKPKKQNWPNNPHSRGLNFHGRKNWVNRGSSSN